MVSDKGRITEQTKDHKSVGVNGKTGETFIALACLRVIGALNIVVRQGRMHPLNGSNRSVYPEINED